MEKNSEVWFILDSGTGNPEENMSIDRALLENALHIGRPLLRLYGWKKAAGTFGFFQKREEIEKITRLRPLVQRPTGGGFVAHINDWTYSIVVPPVHRWYRLKAVESYRLIHQWLSEAFKLLGIQTELASESVRPAPGQCFAGYEKYDLLLNCRKIAGAAQRRAKTGLLTQGSIQPIPEGISFLQWKKALIESAKCFLNVTFEEFVPENYEFLRQIFNTEKKL
ncbi:MAG: lipoyl protein ligase domain-containing protein [Limisphaerales bacterium]